MKGVKIFSALLICLSLTLVSLAALGCAGGGQTNSANGVNRSTGPLFLGDGGRGMRLAVLEPAGRGLSANEQWVPSLIQGSLTSDFNRYSAITVIDRQNLETILAEQNQSMSGNYSDDDFISIGKLTNARYVLAGSINRTPNAIMLELAITDAETGERKASYAPNAVSIEALENLSAVREATADLLAQLGVTLTENGLADLTRPVAVAQVQSQTALARGITANRQGSIVEAMHYFSESVSFNAGFPEADQRFKTLTARIESGNFGENIRNEIQIRNTWDKLLDDAIDFYKKTPYFNLVYSTIPHLGPIDFSNNTARVFFNCWLEPNAGLTVVYNIVKALENTKKMDDWGLRSKAQSLFISDDGLFYILGIKAQLLDERGVWLASSIEARNFYPDLRVMWMTGRGGIQGGRQQNIFQWQVPYRNNFTDLRGGFFASAYAGYGYAGIRVLNFDVDANSISDNFTLRFTELGRLRRGNWNEGELDGVNAVETMTVIPTDKPNAREYFRSRSGFRDFSLYRPMGYGNPPPPDENAYQYYYFFR